MALSSVTMWLPSPRMANPAAAWIAFDAPTTVRSMHGICTPADRVAGQPEAVLDADLGRILALRRRAAEDLGEPRRGHYARRADLALAPDSAPEIDPDGLRIEPTVAGTALLILPPVAGGAVFAATIGGLLAADRLRRTGLIRCHRCSGLRRIRGCGLVQGAGRDLGKRDRSARRPVQVECLSWQWFPFYGALPVRRSAATSGPGIGRSGRVGTRRPRQSSRRRTPAIPEVPQCPGSY
jgi:hypothetical protein